MTARVLRIWRTHNQAPVVFGGSPGDATALQGYARQALAAGVHGISIETPSGLPGLLGHVGRAGAVFAADSAAAHLAAAFDKPSVVITNRRFYGYAQPWGRSARQQESPERLAAALPRMATPVRPPI
jgi:ADP-heptose:LPS heptosyltransferase